MLADMVPLICLPTAHLQASGPAAPSPGVAQVAAAERAFAARAATEGTPAAFLAFLAEDARVFTPKATLARAHYQGELARDRSRLAWYPSYVELAGSGDFALSTGPWSWTAEGAASPVVHGHFLSLWVLREGRWQVLLDVGAPHALQGEEPFSGKVVGAQVDPHGGASLLAAWSAFDGVAAKDLPGAFEAHAAPDLRWYRRGHVPTPGLRPLLAPGAAAWEEGGRHIAASQDLAVRWGERVRGQARASTVQVWRRSPKGWALAMDVELPLPSGKA